MAVHQDSEAARAFEVWYERDRDRSKTARSMEVFRRLGIVRRISDRVCVMLKGPLPLAVPPTLVP